MSDIFTCHSSCAFDDSKDDHLENFLSKLAQFGIDQCIHSTQLITDKLESIQSLSNLHHQTKVHELNDLLSNLQILQNEFYNISVIIPSSNDQNKQMLFKKLQNHLSTFVEINSQLNSLEKSIKDTNRQSINTLNLLAKKFDQSLSGISCLSNKSSVVLSSSFFSNDDINNNNDIGRYWKFANIIHTRFLISLIASDSYIIICYNNRNNLLHFVRMDGQFKGNIKWEYETIVDLYW